MWQTSLAVTAGAAAAYVGAAGALARLGIALPGAPPPRWRLPAAWVTAALAALASLAITAAQGFTPGAVAVELYAAALSVALIAEGLAMPQRQGARIEVFVRVTRWMAAALLAASGAWILVSPRAEQPLLDALERTFPAVRAAYMGDEAAAGAGEAQVGAARESHRWPLGLAFVLLAASVVVSLPLESRPPRS